MDGLDVYQHFLHRFLFVELTCHKPALDGFFIKPLSTILSSAVDKSQQHQEKNSWQCRESNPGLLGEKQVCYLCTLKPPLVPCLPGTWKVDSELTRELRLRIRLDLSSEWRKASEAISGNLSRNQVQQESQNDEGWERKRPRIEFRQTSLPWDQLWSSCCSCCCRHLDSRRRTQV